MYRAFRPSLENLEKREVFAANAAGLAVDAPLLAQGNGRVDAADYVTLQTNDDSSQVLGVAAGDFNGDGRPDLAASGLFGDFDGDRDVEGADFLRSPGGQRRLDMIVDYIDPDLYRAAIDDLIGWNSLLPYLEQDNVYKSSLPFSNTMLDDQGFLSALYQDLLGTSNEAQASDAFFAELEAGMGDVPWSAPDRSQIIAVLIGLVRSQDSGSDRIADVTDGTSNTILFASLAADPTDPSGNTIMQPPRPKQSVTDLVIDPFTSRSLLNSTEYRVGILASAEYYAIAAPFDRGYLSVG